MGAAPDALHVLWTSDVQRAPAFTQRPWEWLRHLRREAPVNVRDDRSDSLARTRHARASRACIQAAPTRVELVIMETFFCQQSKVVFLDAFIQLFEYDGLRFKINFS